jgi:hypothetical protein
MEIRRIVSLVMLRAKPAQLSWPVPVYPANLVLFCSQLHPLLVSALVRVQMRLNVFYAILLV